jgi:hypothetical protein
MCICGCLVVVALLTQPEKRERLCLPRLSARAILGLSEAQHIQADYSALVRIA